MEVGSFARNASRKDTIPESVKIKIITKRKS
jgi:hypothetical protein